jgi:hypothetical protein
MILASKEESTWPPLRTPRHFLMPPALESFDVRIRYQQLRRLTNQFGEQFPWRA